MAQHEYGITFSVTVMVTAPIPNALDAVDWADTALRKAVGDALQPVGYHLGIETIEDAGMAWQIHETGKA